MMLELFILFIIISIILFLLIIETLFYQDSPTATPKEGQHIGNWQPAIALISVNLLFIVLITYGCWNIEWFYMENYWSGNGTFAPAMYSTDSYSVLTYVFVVFFLIHIILFVYVGWMAWKDALSTKGEMDYHKKDNRWR